MIRAAVLGLALVSAAAAVAHAADPSAAPNDSAITAEAFPATLAEYGFFTFLGSLPAPWTMPTEYWLTFENRQLTLFFTLPLSEPWPVGEAAEIEVYDPEFFVDFNFSSPLNITKPIP